MWTGLRGFWGRHIFRYNYIHDINEFASVGNPHMDCFQTFNNGTDSAGTLIENNYCLRVSRHCLIAQNNSAGRYAIRDITFRNESRATTFWRAGSSTGEHFSNNVELLDTSLNQRDSTFNNSRPPNPPSNPNDFTAYRVYAAARDIIDNGSDIRTPNGHRRQPPDRRPSHRSRPLRDQVGPLAVRYRAYPRD